MTHDLSQAIGKPVNTYDDEQLGRATGVVEDKTGKRYLVAAGEMYGTGSYYIPENQIRRIGTYQVLLSVVRADLRELDWLAKPDGVQPVS